MKISHAIVGAFAALSVTATASAATYTFNYTYDGSTLSLDAGDVPDGTVLNIGDTFTINLSAAGSDYFQALTDFSQFFPLSYLVPDPAVRTANIDTNFFLDGALVDSTSETSSQAEVHVGAQQFNFATGFQFDSLSLVWEFVSIDNAAATVISGSLFEAFGSPDRPFFNDAAIAYVNGSAPVPLPAAGILFATVGLFGARTLRKRKSA